MIPRSIAFLFLSLIAGSAAAQLPADEKTAAEVKELRARVVERVVDDVQGLRLPENRAFALTQAGGLICRDDKRSAREFFQRAVDELIAGQLASEGDGRSRPTQAAMYLTRTIRPAVLSSIGTCDAEFALESLYRTRSPAILRDLGTLPDTSGRIGNNEGPGQTAQTELMLEQRFMRLAAEQNPELAAKAIQDSIRKGLSGETLGLLRKLHSKDPDSASALAREVMDRLLGGTFTDDVAGRSEVSLAAAILSNHIRPVRPGSRELRFEDGQVRNLAGRYIAFTIGQSSRRAVFPDVPQAIRIAEKLSPASVAALRKIERERRPPTFGPGPSTEAQRIMGSKSTPAQMISDARRLSVDDRRSVFQSAAGRMADAGEYEAAIAFIYQNFTGLHLENAVQSVNRRYTDALMRQGRWQEAEDLIHRFPDEITKRNSLIELAKRAFAKDAEANRALASNVLNRVRASLPERPADQASTASLVQVAVAYAPIDRDETFAVMGSIVPVLNDLADANAHVLAFRSDAYVRQGEFTILPTPAIGLSVDPSVWRALFKADADRADKLIDSLTRRELRIAIRLQLAQQARSEPPGLP